MPGSGFLLQLPVFNYAYKELKAQLQKIDCAFYLYIPHIRRRKIAKRKQEFTFHDYIERPLRDRI